MRWLMVLRTSAISFTVYLVLWQAYIMFESRGGAHGVGYYRAWAPVFFMTGALFMFFGVFLVVRK